MAKKIETKKTATKTAVKETTVKPVTKKEECNCNCGCNNGEMLNYVKYSFYALVCIFVCALISTIFIIILAVGDDKNTNKNNNTSSKTSTSTNQGTKTEENTDYDVSMFEQITAQQLIDLYNGSEKSVIYVGRATCGYCVKFLPALQKAQEELGYKTYYYDISTITSDEYYEIIALNDFLNENFGSTPMVIVVQNGQILSTNNDNKGWVGYAEYDTFKAYMQGLGY